jgi:cobalt-zinc-cadmium efflux system outer membrane protein
MYTQSPICSSKKPIVNRFYNRSIQIKTVSFLLIAVLSISFSVAANPQETGTILSFSEAINKTLKHHPELNSFSHQYKANEGLVKQSRLSTRKELNLNVEDFAGTDELEGVNSLQSTLSVSWVMENDLISSRYNFAQSSKGMIQSAEEIKRLELANETAELFINALALQEQVLIINQAIQFSESAVKEINKKVAAGKSNPADLLRAQAELANQNLLADDLKHEIQIAQRYLAAQWGEQSLNGSSLVGSLAVNNETINFESLKTRVNQNPQITQLATLEKINAAKIDLAVAENKPRWKFMTGLRRNERNDDVSVVAGFTLPIGGKNRSEGKIDELKATMSENISDNDALKVSLETSLYAFFQLMNHNVHLAETLSAQIIPKLKEAQAKTYDAYLKGSYGYMDLKNVQDDLIDAHLTLLEAKLNFHLNKIEIESITGSQLFSTPEGM